MTNVVIIQGRITRDLETRFTQSNTPVVSFTLANDTGFGDKKKTSFLDCVAWSKTAETLATYCSKGSMINVTGELGVRAWKDKDGNTRKTTEITVREFSFCESKSTSELRGHNLGGYNSDDFEEIADDGIPLPF